MSCRPVRLSLQPPGASGWRKRLRALPSASSFTVAHILRRDNVVELDPVELRLERIGESRLDFGGGCGNFQVMQADQTALAGTDFVRRGRQ